MTKKNELEIVVHPLEPLYNSESQVLILGSLPSSFSRECHFYYAHPRNRFWSLLATILKEDLPSTNEAKKNLLLRHHIALWDVIKSCRIHGSSDQSIKDVVVNDINMLIKNSQIQTIFTNGKTAKKFYDKYCLEKTKIQAIPLPSSSPANASYSFDKLLSSYQVISTKIKP